tara:strand:- start:602 stop:1075 length:474 start_codon:yes stop_codon:yes gene_type:complete
MIVVLHYADGEFSTIHYERKRLETYLAQQIKSTADFDKMDFIRIEYEMHHELVIPKGIKINRFLRNRFEAYTDKDGGMICIPCVTFQLCEDEELWEKTDLNPSTIMFKDIIVLPMKVERQLLRLFEISKDALFKKRKSKQKPKGRKRGSQGRKKRKR